LGYRVWGLDMRFLGRKWRNKNDGGGLSSRSPAGMTTRRATATATG
jgi:hypothetical protein